MTPDAMAALAACGLIMAGLAILASPGRRAEQRKRDLAAAKKWSEARRQQASDEALLADWYKSQGR